MLAPLTAMAITADGVVVGWSENQEYSSSEFGTTKTLVHQIHEAAKHADLDGDETGYLIARFAELKRR